jgi:hypothetical protein
MRFSVNILSGKQSQIAKRFAEPGVLDRFRGIPHEFVHGVPILDGVVCALVCNVADTLSGGDHTIFLGSPIAALLPTGETTPLVYLNRGCRQLVS